MALDENIPNHEIIDATQDAVLSAAESVAEVIETTAHEIGGHGEVFYQSAEFWVAMSFVVVVVGLGRPIGKVLYALLKGRGEAIAERIKNAASLKEDAQKLLVEYEKKHHDAEQEAQDILQRSEREINFIKKESLARLEKDLAAKERDTKARIAASQDRAVQEVSRMAAGLTVRAVKKVLSEKLSEKEHDRLIEESIDKIA